MVPNLFPLNSEISYTGSGNLNLQTYFKKNGRGYLTVFASSINAFTSDVSNWSNGIRPVPAERCPVIEQATNGLVTCEELRPDIPWGVLRNKQPESVEA
jgi:hypothetical protein